MSDLRQRDANIVNNWYIACLSNEVDRSKAISRKIYDKDYVIFRDSNNKAVVLLNRCLHRLTQMHTGRVIDGQLACPYHGWRYDSNGNVTHIPSEGPNQREKKLCSKPLPSYEQDGCIWVWMGEDEPSEKTPPWRFPYYQDKKWVKYFMITEFDNEVTNLCENFMDVPHTIYVHQDWFRNQAYKKVPMSVETKDARVLVTYKQENDQIAGLLYRLLNPNKAPMKHTDEYIYPNLTRVDYTFEDKYGFIINSQNTPVSTLKSRTYTYIAYRMAAFNKLVKPFIHFYTRQVIEQDVDIMKEQGRALAIDPTTNFRSTDADELHIAIERLRQFGRQGSDQLNTFTDKKEKDFWI